MLLGSDSTCCPPLLEVCNKRNTGGWCYSVVIKTRCQTGYFFTPRVEKEKTLVWKENSAGKLWDMCESDICSPDCTIDWHARWDNLIVQERLIDRTPKTSFICNKQHEYWLTHDFSSLALIWSPHNLQKCDVAQLFMVLVLVLLQKSPEREKRNKNKKEEGKFRDRSLEINWLIESASTADGNVALCVQP